MEELVQLIVTNIVTQPDKVQIDTQTQDSTLKFTIMADKDDLGKIIGKNGKTIQAIRTLVKTLAAQEHLWVTIDVVEALKGPTENIKDISMRIDILTLFPDMFSGILTESMLKRFQNQGLVSIHLHNFRDYTTDKHQTVDDAPYGGGAGMVLKVDILVTALEAITNHTLPKSGKTERIYFMSPKGPTFDQPMARDLALLEHLVLICGHYEDADARLLDFIDGTISIGNFVLTGGEIPAMAIIDAVARLIPGALTPDSLKHESFTTNNLIEYPQYTKPESYRGKKVPDVLRSGNHQAIHTWRSEQMIEKSDK